MSKRAIILFSTFFGVAALCFALIAVNSIALGPDPAHPSATQMASRTAAANKLQHQIDTVRAQAPPSLPQVPQRISVSSAGGSGATATPVPVVVVPASSAAPTPQASGRAAPMGDDAADDHGFEEGDQSDD